MGLDLALLPFDGDHGDFAFSHTVIQCGRASELCHKLETAPQMKVPEGFSSYLSRDAKYEESHYGTTIDTPYGNPLMFVEVESLLALKNLPMVQESPKNRRAWAYLAELPPRTKVALFWH